MTLSKEMADRLDALTDFQLNTLFDVLEGPSETAQNIVAKPGRQAVGRKVLIAYYLKKNGSDVASYAESSTNHPVHKSETEARCAIVDGLEEQQLRDYCQSKLPPHMCPTRYVALDRIPTLPNGKMSYADLPLPGPQQGSAGTHDDASRSPALALIASILGELLGMDDVRASDNFFEIGGDSITAIQFISRARQAGLKIEVAAVSQSKSVADIAALSEDARLSRTDNSDSHAEIDPLPDFAASGLNENELDDFLQSFE